MSINWWMNKEIGVYIHNGILLGNEKEWNLAIFSNMDGAGGYYAKWNKSVRERQTPYVFTHMWNLRNLTEDHGGRGRGKIVTNWGREANHKRLLNTEKKLRMDGAGGEGKMGDGLVGMSTGCCMEAMNHGNLPPKPRAHCLHCILANLTINHVKKTDWGTLEIIKRDVKKHNRLQLNAMLDSCLDSGWKKAKKKWI